MARPALALEALAPFSFALSATAARRVRGAPSATFALFLGLERPLEESKSGLEFLEVRGVSPSRSGTRAPTSTLTGAPAAASCARA
eukprot:13228892-Alexandrium_andersonii.AAC.1